MAASPPDHTQPTAPASFGAKPLTNTTAAASRRPRPCSAYSSRVHGPNPELLDHRPHRPRQVDPGRSLPRADGRRRPRSPPPAARLDGARARARDHDQGAGGAGLVRGARRRDLPPPPHRHPGPRGLLVRGLAQPRRLRGGAAGRRCRAGRRGADGRQHLRRRRGGARADPGAEQGGPAERRAGARRGGGDRPDRRGPRRGAADLGQDGRGGGGGAGGDRGAHPAARGQPSRTRRER